MRGFIIPRSAQVWSRVRELGFPYLNSTTEAYTEEGIEKNRIVLDVNRPSESTAEAPRKWWRYIISSQIVALRLVRSFKLGLGDSATALEQWQGQDPEKESESKTNSMVYKSAYEEYQQRLVDAPEENEEELAGLTIGNENRAVKFEVDLEHHKRLLYDAEDERERVEIENRNLREMIKALVPLAKLSIESPSTSQTISSILTDKAGSSITYEPPLFITTDDLGLTGPRQDSQSVFVSSEAHLFETLISLLKERNAPSEIKPPLVDEPMQRRPTPLHVQASSSARNSSHIYLSPQNRKMFPSTKAFRMNKSISGPIEASGLDSSSFGRPYFLNRTSTSNWTNTRNSPVVVQPPLSSNNRPLTAGTVPRISKYPANNKIEVSYLHEPLPSSSLVEFHKSIPYERPSSPYASPVRLSDAYVAECLKNEPVRPLSNSVQISGNKTNRVVLNDLVRKSSSSRIALDKYKGKNTDRPDFNNRLSGSSHFEKTSYGEDPISKENTLTEILAKHQYHQAIAVLDKKLLESTERSPFEDSRLGPSYPLPPAKNFLVESEKRKSKEKKYIEKVYNMVENETALKSSIITKVIEDARHNHSGKRAHRDKPLTKSEMALAESPLLRHATHKNHYRF